jgi:hypothetical protein
VSRLTCKSSIVRTADRRFLLVRLQAAETNGRLEGCKITLRLVCVLRCVFDRGPIELVLGAQESGDHRLLCPREGRSCLCMSLRYRTRSPVRPSDRRRQPHSSPVSSCRSGSHPRPCRPRRRGQNQSPWNRAGHQYFPDPTHTSPARPTYHSSWHPCHERAAPVTAADTDGNFLDAGKDKHAHCLVEHTLREAVVS